MWTSVSAGVRAGISIVSEIFSGRRGATWLRRAAWEGTSIGRHTYTRQGQQRGGEAGRLLGRLRAPPPRRGCLRVSCSHGWPVVYIHAYSRASPSVLPSSALAAGSVQDLLPARTTRPVQTHHHSESTLRAFPFSVVWPLPLLQICFAIVDGCSLAGYRPSRAVESRCSSSHIDLGSSLAVTVRYVSPLLALDRAGRRAPLSLLIEKTEQGGTRKAREHCSPSFSSSCYICNRATTAAWVRYVPTVLHYTRHGFVVGKAVWFDPGKEKDNRSLCREIWPENAAISVAGRRRTLSVSANQSNTDSRPLLLLV